MTVVMVGTGEEIYLCGLDCRCRRYHVLGCPGHPFHPDYSPLLSPERRRRAQIEGTKALYVAEVIEADEMERRIATALRGDRLEGDVDKP